MNAIVRELQQALMEMPRAAPPATCALPCNEHTFQVLARLQAAVLALDDFFAIVERIEIIHGEPTIYLRQAPKAGAVGSIFELVRVVDGQRQVFCRSRFMGCTLEWLTL